MNSPTALRAIPVFSMAVLASILSFAGLTGCSRASNPAGTPVAAQNGDIPPTTDSTQASAPVPPAAFVADAASANRPAADASTPAVATQTLTTPVADKAPMQKTKDEWLKQLGPAKYRILREAGTERAFSHEFWKKEPSDGSYRCAGCGTKLFEGTSKFISECGWPAFDKAVPGTIKYVEDRSYGMLRTEVRCTACDGHLGHVFDDGPTDTGQRYCINGLAIDYAEKAAASEQPPAEPAPKPAPKP